MICPTCTRLCLVGVYSRGTRVCTLGIPGCVLWRYPGMYSSGTRVCTLGTPGYVLWGYPGMYSGRTRVCTLWVPGYALWGYPGRYSSLLLSSSTRRRFYPQRSSGQAVVTGIVPSPPRYVPSSLSRIWFSISAARRLSSTVAN